MNRLSKIGFIFMVFLMPCFALFGQEKIPPPNVCPGEKGLQYGVDGNENSTFVWAITGGYFINESGARIADDTLITFSDRVIVDWIESSDIVTSSYSLSVLEISEHGCVGERTSVSIGFKDASKVVLENGLADLDLCAGELKTFDAGAGFIYYYWTGFEDTLQGENARYFSVARMSQANSDVIIHAYSVDNCETVDTVNVSYRPLPKIAFESKMVGSDLTNIPEDKLIVTGDTLKICKTEYEISPGTFASYQWSTGDNAAFIRMGEIQEDSLLSVTVTNYFGKEVEVGCSSTDTILIQACDVPITVYTAFTPNGDGVNEEWVIEGIENFPDADVIIYDRHQNKVFESVKPYKNWNGRRANGKLLPVDSYHYLIKLNDEKDQQFRGQVTIVY